MSIDDVIQLARHKVRHHDEEKVTVRSVGNGNTIVKFLVVVEKEQIEEQIEENKKAPN